VGGFLWQFWESTLENWQSEFLQLFSFVVVSAVLIHHGSSESKDGTERLERSVEEIRTMLRDAGLPRRANR
jgi:SNF2 family DNA or RNA helicase